MYTDIPEAIVYFGLVVAALTFLTCGLFLGMMVYSEIKRKAKREVRREDYLRLYTNTAMTTNMVSEMQARLDLIEEAHKRETE